MKARSLWKKLDFQQAAEHPTEPGRVQETSQCWVQTPNRRENTHLVTEMAETPQSDQPLCIKGFSLSGKQMQFPVLAHLSVAAHPVISICKKNDQANHFSFISSKTNTSSLLALNAENNVM